MKLEYITRFYLKLNKTVLILENSNGCFQNYISRDIHFSQQHIHKENGNLTIKNKRLLLFVYSTTYHYKPHLFCI